MRSLKTPSRKPKKEKFICRKGPYNGRTILLTSPHSKSAVFRVGNWIGFYEKTIYQSSSLVDWVEVSL